MLWGKCGHIFLLCTRESMEKLSKVTITVDAQYLLVQRYQQLMPLTISTAEWKVEPAGFFTMHM